jgi:dynein heavy chain, axonemal
VPDSVDIDMFRQTIETLPGTESPEVFGLHPNADITFRTLQVCASPEWPCGMMRCGTAL